jgi:hypothetical protein
MSWNQLPRELHQRIGGYGGVEDVRNLRATSRELRNTFTDPYFRQSATRKIHINPNHPVIQHIYQIFREETMVKPFTNVEATVFLDALNGSIKIIGQDTIITGTMRNNKPFGEWIYDEKDDTHIVGYFDENGQKTGTWVFENEADDTRHDFTFNHGQLNGPERGYDYDSDTDTYRLGFQANNKNGDKHGLEITYNDDGLISNITVYFEGETVYYKNYTPTNQPEDPREIKIPTRELRRMNLTKEQIYEALHE